MCGTDACTILFLRTYRVIQRKVFPRIGSENTAAKTTERTSSERRRRSFVRRRQSRSTFLAKVFGRIIPRLCAAHVYTARVSIHVFHDEHTLRRTIWSPRPDVWAPSCYSCDFFFFFLFNLFARRRLVWDRTYCAACRLRNLKALGNLIRNYCETKRRMMTKQFSGISCR